MGTEIHTFTSLKELSEYVTSQTLQYKAMFEDYSQWLGTVLRDCESTHKDEEWFKKSAAAQKNLKVQTRTPERNDKNKKSGKGGKGKTAEASSWVQAGSIALSFTEQGQTELLFEVIEKLKLKMREYETFKGTLQQLTRLGLGATVNYIVYIEDDIPKKIVLKPKAKTGDEAFKFITELSVPAYYSEPDT